MGINFFSYTGRFGGTSAAAPQISGIAALVLAINPNLTHQQVFNIIMNSADEVGGYNYVNGRSDELGTGRANACRAVHEAYISTNPISGPDRICTTNTNFTLQNVPAGQTVTWAVSPTYLFPSTGRTGTGTTATLHLSVVQPPLPTPWIRTVGNTS
ncbi:S8 family serine peptidase [Cyclobacterium sediminis]